MTTGLPIIPQSSRLTPLIVRVNGGNPGKFTLQGTNTYLLGKGPERILIDTGQGFPAWRETLQRVLNEENAKIKTILLTHHHHDHTDGLKDVPREHNGVEAWKHPAEPSTEMYRNMLKQSLDGWASEVKPLEDDLNFNIPGEDGVFLKVIHAPGHTPDHCAFIMDYSRPKLSEDEFPILFTGDAILGHGTAVFEDLAVYLESLQKMKAEVTRVMPKSGNVKAYPAHGEVIQDAAAKIQEYISHRAQREREVIDVLRQHSADGNGIDPMGIVKIIYKNYPENLHAPAEGGIKLILKKLEEEGKSKSNGDRWSLIEQIGRESNKPGL